MGQRRSEALRDVFERVRGCLLICAAATVVLGGFWNLAPAWGDPSVAPGDLASTPGQPMVGAEGGCKSTPPDASAGAHPFAGICEYLAGRQGVVEVALFNKLNGNTYVLTNGDNIHYTASIVKADILALWLHTYQQHGTKIPGEIPYSIQYLMQRMIENSDNAAATALFHFAGGCDALTGFNQLIPMAQTKVGCESATYYGWGNTITTAADQIKLIRVYAYGERDEALGTDARTYGLQLMQSVEPDQRFGITCGPWGTSCAPPNYAQPVPGVTVALKNGWKTLPTCTAPVEQCPWQVNSEGWVDGQGRNYVLAVLTTNDPVGSGGTYGFSYGIDTVQNVSQRIWTNLG